MTAIRRAWVAIVESRQRARRAHPQSVTRLRAVTEIVIGARHARRTRFVPNTVLGVATIDRAGIAVVELGRGPGFALSARRAELAAVTNVPVGAARPGGQRLVPCAERRIATVRGTRVLVVEDWHRAGYAAPARIANAHAVADVAVVAEGTRGTGGVRDARGQIASVIRAGVAVVGGRGRSGAAVAGAVAAFIAVAVVRIGAARAARHRIVMNSRGRIAAVDRACIGIVDGQRRTRLADARAVTGFTAVAWVRIGTVRTVGKWRVDDAACGIARIRGAGVAVVDVGRLANAANTRGRADASEPRLALCVRSARTARRAATLGRAGREIRHTLRARREGRMANDRPGLHLDLFPEERAVELERILGVEPHFGPRRYEHAAELPVDLGVRSRDPDEDAL